MTKVTGSDWNSLLKESFVTKEGRFEELHILQGLTFPVADRKG